MSAQRPPGDARPRARRRSARTRQLRLLAVVATVSVLAGGTSLALALHHGATRPKIVHVVLTAPPPSARASDPPRHHRHHRRRVALAPAASAGTNGSFTPPVSSLVDSPLKPDAPASFARLRATLGGQVDLAAIPLGAGSGVVLGGNRPAAAWSTSKIPVLVALLRARGAQGLTATERGWAQRAITESDNQSVLDLFGDLEQLEGGLVGASLHIQQLFRQSGDRHTVVATASPPPGAVTTFGQTEWAPGRAVKFFRALANGCLLPADQTHYVLSLMQGIEPSESWGLGSGGFSVPVAFKGGWGPEPTGAYLVRQSGIIDPGSDRGVAVSIVAYPPPGGDSFGVGIQMLTRTAQWLRDEVALEPRAPRGCQS